MLLEKLTNFFYNRNIQAFDFFPNTIKIDKYQYYFSSRNHFAKTGRAFNKHFINEYLFEIDIEAANKLNKIYGIPEINKDRIIRFSVFLNLPLYDLVICLFLFQLIRKALNI